MILLSLASLIALPVQVGGGWEVTHEIHGGSYHVNLGENMAGVRDLDGDGAGEFIIGGSVFEPGNPRAGFAGHVYSGRTGLQIFRLLGPGGELIGTGGVADLGDVNLDGLTDLLVGSYTTEIGGLYQVGSAFVLSGADGSMISRADGLGEADRLGHVVAAIGDVDGDGRPDYFSGSWMASRGQTFHGAGGVFSGISGARLRDHEGDSASDSWSTDACGLGDWDFDGVPDYAVSAETTRPGGRTEAGSVYLYSGATGQLIHRWDGLAAGDHFGASIANAGDFDADGRDDLLVGAPGVSASLSELHAGAAYLISAATRQIVNTYAGSGRLTRLGFSVDGAGDQDQDGHADLLLGAPGADPLQFHNIGAVYVVSGRTSAVLHQITGLPYRGAYSGCGRSVADAGDLDGDGNHHVLVGYPFEDGNGYQAAGAVRVHALQPFLALSAGELSVGAGGSILFSLDFPDAAGGLISQLLVSRSGTGPSFVRGVAVPLTADALFHQTLARRYPPFVTGFLGVLSASGQTGAALTIAPGQLAPGLIGTTLHFAALARNLNGGVLYSSRARPLLLIP